MRSERVQALGSIRTYLNALVLVVVVPLLVLAWLLAANYARSQTRVLEAQRSDVVSNLAFLVERDTERIVSALKTLAVSPELENGKLDVFRQHLEAAFPVGEQVMLVDRSGAVLVATQAARGVRVVPIGDDHFKKVFEGRINVSGFREEAVSRKPSFMVSVPVTIAGKVTYVLSADVGVERLAGLFSEAELKPQWIAAIVDANGLLLARNIAIDRFVGKRVPTEAAAAAKGTQDSGTFENQSMDGVQTSNIFRQSKATGWTLFVAVPTRNLHAPLVRAYNFLAVVGVGLTALGLGLAYLLADRVSRAVNNLRQAALDVAEGREVAPSHYAVSELGEVAKVFEYAGSISLQHRLDEAKLKESDERRRLALDAGLFATWDIDLETGQAIWSTRLYELLGYPVDASQQANTQMWLDRMHPEDRAASRSAYEHARDNHHIYVGEYRFFRADTQEMRWLRSNGQFHYDSDGKAKRLVGVMRDVTERKLMELALRESETQYRSALTVGRMGSWETYFVTGTRKWSSEAQSLFGFSLQDGIGSVGGDRDEFLLALHPDDRKQYAILHEMAQTTDSFPAEYRIVRPGGAVVWLSGRGQVFARDVDGKCQRLVSVMADVTEQKKAEQHVRFLLREMSHRSKNLLAVIQAIAGQTLRTSSSMSEFAGRFEQRLQGLAASHDILVDQNWQGATLSGLVRRQLLPFIEPDNARVRITGPAVDLNATAAQAVGLALHELATNAVKYGALSTPVGTLTVSWDFSTGADDISLILNWVEDGGPTVVSPGRKGFGNAVIERMAPSSVAGSVILEYAPSGLRWRLTIPEASLIIDDDTPLPSRATA